MQLAPCHVCIRFGLLLVLCNQILIISCEVATAPTFMLFLGSVYYYLIVGPVNDVVEQFWLETKN